MAKHTAPALRTVNLEQGKPKVEQAIARMNQAVFSARASGTKVIKLIHGYGSSGKGGVIRTAVYRELETKIQRCLESGDCAEAQLLCDKLAAVVEQM